MCGGYSVTSVSTSALIVNHNLPLIGTQLMSSLIRRQTQVKVSDDVWWLALSMLLYQYRCLHKQRFNDTRWRH